MILAPWNIICTIHVSPINLLWQIFQGKFLPRHFMGTLFSFWKLQIFIFEFSTRVFKIYKMSIWILIISVCRVIKNILSFDLSSFMSYIICPCIFRHSPSTVTFYIHIINSSSNLKESLITPCCTPRVFNFPKRNIVFYAKYNNFKVVINTHSSCSILKNTWFIFLFKFLSQCHATYYRTSLKYLNHHLMLPTKMRIWFNAIYRIRIWYKALSIRSTSLTK